MVLLYAELFVLLLVSFLLGSGLAAGVVRLLVRQRADRVAAYVGEASSR
jgi:hypothetical protein